MFSFSSSFVGRIVTPSFYIVRSSVQLCILHVFTVSIRNAEQIHPVAVKVCACVFEFVCVCLCALAVGGWCSRSAYWFSLMFLFNNSAVFLYNFNAIHNLIEPPLLEARAFLYFSIENIFAVDFFERREVSNYFFKPKMVKSDETFAKRNFFFFSIFYYVVIKRTFLLYGNAANLFSFRTQRPVKLSEEISTIKKNRTKEKQQKSP